jgi:cysteine-rich repeat protein
MNARFWLVGALLISDLLACKVYEPSLASSVTAGSSRMDSGAPETDAQAAPSVDPDSQDEDGGSSPNGGGGSRYPAQQCSGGDCWWSDPLDTACRSVRAPQPSDRPDPERDGNEHVDDIYLGFTRFWVGPTDLNGNASDSAWQTFGLDLDGLCTNSSTCPEQQTVAQSCKPATDQIPFDGQLCRDNTFASLQPVAAAAPEVGKRFGISEDIFNCELWRGTYNIVLKISNWNGSPEDSDVRLDIYQSPGLVNQPQWKCPIDNPRDTYPQWRSFSPWLIDPANLAGPITESGKLPDSNIADAHAYVRGAYIVARPPVRASLRFEGNAKPYRGYALETEPNGYWIGNIYRAQDNTWHIRDGLSAGAITSDALIRSIRQVGLCPGKGLDGFYSDVVDYINTNADVLADGSVDPTRPCDAISVGQGFEASELTPGPTGDPVPLVECCDPGVAIEDCKAACGDGQKNGDESCDTAIAAGVPGACPTGCPNSDPCQTQRLVGSDCSAHCETTTITAVGAADGCCPKGADATRDRDCKPICGNSVVEAGETCDPSSSCQACRSNDRCLKARASGSANDCTLTCEYVKVTACQNGDGCCAPGCTNSNDNDCSSSCGNSVLDPNETCDANTSKPCPSSCDDKNSCTTDMQTGDPKSCNVTCTSIPITTSVNTDGCCPPGASPNSDSDCKSLCGNNVVEPGEQCDDANTTPGDGCDAKCQSETPTTMCQVKLMAGIPDCVQCTCDKCTSQALACQGASSADDAKACNDLVQCGLMNNCVSDACYCGSASTLACGTGGANGACIPQVEAAAHSSSALDIETRSDSDSYPLGRANHLAACVISNCASQCGVM